MAEGSGRSSTLHLLNLSKLLEDNGRVKGSTEDRKKERQDTLGRANEAERPTPPPGTVAHMSHKAARDEPTIALIMGQAYNVYRDSSAAPVMQRFTQDMAPLCFITLKGSDARLRIVHSTAIFRAELGIDGFDLDNTPLGFMVNKVRGQLLTVVTVPSTYFRYKKVRIA